MRATLFAGLLCGAVYCLFILGDDFGYVFLIGAFLLYLYAMFTAALR